jgi:hypothetical protein
VALLLLPVAQCDGSHVLKKLHSHVNATTGTRGINLRAVTDVMLQVRLPTSPPMVVAHQGSQSWSCGAANEA